MQALTKRQREIYDFIEAYISEKRYSPTYREIQDHFGLSSLGSVYNLIKSLKKRGFLAQNIQQNRSLCLINAGKEGVEIPLIGTLQGGMPIETFPKISTLFLPPALACSSGPCYALQVRGRELEEEFIRAGDCLVVLSTTTFENGELILVQVSGETTFVKRGYLDPPYFRLESDNAEVQPIILRQDHIQVLGRILSLIRHY